MNFFQSPTTEASGQQLPFIPPGVRKRDADEEPELFGHDFQDNFCVPRRLQQTSHDLVSAVNDWHFAMMNDVERNEFFWEALKDVIVPNQTGVLEIGAGSGLLSIIAASLGAKWVVAVEAQESMADVARHVIKANGFEDRITVINKLSTDMTVDELPQPADVLLSEILGTTLLGESALDYVEDARVRLLRPGGHIVPRRGRQYAMLIQSNDLADITSVQRWAPQSSKVSSQSDDEYPSVDLSFFNTFKDTASLVFTKTYGFRLSSVGYEAISDRISVFDCDFVTDSARDLPAERSFLLQSKMTGVAHAVCASWEVDCGKSVMATHPDATTQNFPRDMQWGQALQLVEDYADNPGGAAHPQSFFVKAGEWLKLIVRYSTDGVAMQFELERLTEEDALGDNRIESLH